MSLCGSTGRPSFSRIRSRSTRSIRHSSSVLSTSESRASIANRYSSSESLAVSSSSRNSWVFSSLGLSTGSGSGLKDIFVPDRSALKRKSGISSITRMWVRALSECLKLRVLLRRVKSRSFSRSASMIFPLNSRVAPGEAESGAFSLFGPFEDIVPSQKDKC